MKRWQIPFSNLGALVALLVMIALPSGCIKPKITIFPDATEPLKESVLEGEGKGKVAVIFINGFISDTSKGASLSSKPSMLQEVVSQLKLAEDDEDVKAIVLKIDSPGGSITASDMIYHEINAYKIRTKAKVVAAMMDLATSGGYYVALAGDYIVAHPTTITGSIGVIFLRPKVTGLMGKIGLDVEVNKFGKNKDMGSPFRPTTADEEEILQGLIDRMGQRFLDLVIRRRNLNENALAEISTARIFLAEEALRLGLVDQVGYIDEAVSKARKMAGLPADAKVVAYRRTEYPDDNIYNSATTQYRGGGVNLIELGLPEYMLPPSGGGLYYLWLPGGSGQ